MYNRSIKRLFDVIFSILGLIITLPITIIITIILTLGNHGNPFFMQNRPGKNGTLFTYYKFKSMSDHEDKSGKLLPDKDRLTKFGVFLRQISLDEIPQLINVLKGEMSLIGPRPLLEEYLPHYNKEQVKRHDVRPGITGWAQVNGRNSISWKEKFELDTWYVQNLSFALDLKILWMTVINVIKREGINSSKDEAMPKFTGNIRNN